VRQKFKIWTLAKPLRTAVLFFFVGVLVSTISQLFVDLEGFLAAPWRIMALMALGTAPVTVFAYWQLQSYKEKESSSKGE